jgi:hypothetical protein
MEGVGPITALRRSWRLTQGVWWHTAVVLLADGLISSVLGGVVGGVAGALGGGLGFLAGNAILSAAVTAVLSTLASLVVQPFTVPIIVVLYYELRARSEGFDLEQRARSLAPQA